MSNNISNQDAWNILKSLAKKVGGVNEVNNYSVERMLKVADRDNDGAISDLEFKETYLDSSEYASLEDDYMEAMEAFNAVAQNDNEISSEDLAKAMSDNAEPTADKGNGAGGTGGTGATGGTKPPTAPDASVPPTSDPAGLAPTPDAGAQANEPTKASPISSSDLAGKDAATLQNDRTALTNTIAAERGKKEADVTTARQTTNEKKGAYDDAVDGFKEARQGIEESTKAQQEAGEKVKTAEKQMDVAETAVTNQKSVIADIQSVADAAHSALSGLSEPPRFIYSEVTDEDGKTTVQQNQNPEYDAYLAKKAELEAQVAEAESQLDEQEAQLTNLEAQLTASQTAHQEAVNEYVETFKDDTEIYQKLQAAQTAITDTKAAYDAATLEENNIEQKWDAQIDILQSNLGVYNDAIIEAEKEKEGSMPEGYSVQDGVLVSDGDKNKHVLTPMNLPANAEITDKGEIRVDNKLIGKVVGEQYYMIEPAPLEDKEINDIVDRLVNGDNGDPNRPWSYNRGVDFSKINSYDLARIEELYNKQVEAHNRNVVFAQDRKSSFRDKIDDVKADDKKDPRGFDTLQSKFNLIDTRDNQETTFEEFLEKEGIDPSEASPVFLKSYLNEYQNQGKSEKEVVYNEQNLTDAEVTELVSAFLEGAQNGKEDGNLTASEVMEQFDFASLSPESLAKVVKEYNAYVDENGGSSFADMAEFSLESEKPGQLKQIVSSLVETLDDPKLAEVSQKTLEELVKSELEQGESPSLSAILDKASSDVTSLANVKKFIENSGIMDKDSGYFPEEQDFSETQNRITDIMEKTPVSKYDLELASQLAQAEYKTVWDDKKIAEMTETELYSLKTAYDNLNGEGSFMEKMSSLYKQNGADIIMSSVAENSDIGEGAKLSEGQDPKEYIKNNMDTKEKFEEVVSKLIEDAKSGDEATSKAAMQDLAILAHNYGDDGVKDFIADYKQITGEAPSEYTKIREVIDNKDAAVASDTRTKAVDAHIQGIKDSVSGILEQIELSLQEGFASGATDADVDAIQKAIREGIEAEDLTPQEKLSVMKSLAADDSYKEYVLKYLEGDTESSTEKVEKLFGSLESNSEKVDFVKWYNELYSAVNAEESGSVNDEGTNYFIQDMGIDEIMPLYDNATPQELQELNEAFDPVQVVNTLNEMLMQSPYSSDEDFEEVASRIDAFIAKVAAPTDGITPKEMLEDKEVELDGQRRSQLKGSYIHPKESNWVDEDKVDMSAILEAYDSGNISRDSAIWLFNELFNDNDKIYQHNYHDVTKSIGEAIIGERLDDEQKQILLRLYMPEAGV